LSEIGPDSKKKKQHTLLSILLSEHLGKQEVNTKFCQAKSAEGTKERFQM
jgi:hypothetical protein